MLSKSPLNYWRLGEPSGTNADDLGSANQDGTYVNSPTLGVTGLVPNDADTAVSFNGTTQSITTTAQIGAGTTRTIVWLCRWASLPAAYEPIIGNYSSFDFAFVGLNATQRAELFLNNGSPSTSWNPLTTTILANATNRCVLAIDQPADAAQLWINGVSQGSKVVTDNSAAANLSIGNNIAGGEFFAGTMDEVAIMPTVWVQADVDEFEQNWAGRPATTSRTFTSVPFMRGT